jgi:hypothetical protein
MIGTRVKMRHIGLLGTIEAIIIENMRVIVRWDSGLTTRAWVSELEML